MDVVSHELPDPEYPNSPLSGTVFEIRFPGEPAIECHRDLFFEKARGEFPRVLVPKLQPGAAAALSPYHFQREDESASLLTALNLFAFHTQAYPGFAHFRHEVLRWVGIFADEFRINRLTRTGLRYTNIIPYAPEELFPVGNFLDVEIRLGVIKSSSFGRFSLSAVVPTASGGSLTVQINEVQNESQQSAIFLDFDYSMAGDLHISNVGKYLDDSHAETKRLFEGLLTKQYKAFLKGEGLE